MRILECRQVIETACLELAPAGHVRNYRQHAILRDQWSVPVWPPIEFRHRKMAVNAAQRWLPEPKPTHWFVPKVAGAVRITGAQIPGSC